jgi:hypothetical protein
MNMTTVRNKRGAARVQALQDWLNKHDARCMWSAHVDGAEQDNGARVEAHMMSRGDGRPVIILINYFADGAGWEIYAPVSSEISIVATLAAAEKALGLSV